MCVNKIVTLLCTSCCLNTCCKKCAKDIQIECHCYSSPNMFIICNKNPNNKLKECEDSLADQKEKWATWIESIKGAIWKLEIPLEEYISAFKKSVDLYEDRLETLRSMNNQGYFVDEVPLFEWEIPRHIMVINKKGKKFVNNTKFIDFFERNIDKDWDWDSLSQNPNITWEIIEKYIEKPWTWCCVSNNPNITFDIVLKYIDQPWGWRWLSMSSKYYF